MASLDDTRKEIQIYKAIKKLFHNPIVGNKTAKKIYDTYKAIYPQSKYNNSLKYKYLWHRKIKGYNYKNVANIPLGEQFISQRQTSISQNDDRDRGILLFTHELSLTGAPRALLNMAITLKQNGYDPYIFSLKPGPLAEECKKFDIPVVLDIMQSLNLSVSPLDNDVLDFFRSFKTVLLNTVETFKMLKLPLFSDNATKLAWIHESAQSYIQWTLDEFENIIDKLSQVYVVGEHARNNALQFSSHATEFKNLYYCIQSIDSNQQQTDKFNDGKLHLLIAGTIGERKGHHILAKALSILTEDEREKIQIHCAGATDDLKIKETLEPFSPETVTFEGNMNHDDLIALLNKCDALLCPSLDDPMPIVCTEAFQHKIPVVVSDHTGTASFIENCKNGFVVEANSPESLAQALRHIINNKETLPEIGRRGESIYLNNFTEDVFKQNVLDIFSSYIS